MKNTIKKTVLFLFAVALCLAALVSFPDREAKADGYLRSGNEWYITDEGKLVVNIEKGNFPTKWTGTIYVPEWYDDKDKIYTAEINMGSPKDLSHMFDGCQNLASISFNEFDTSNVEYMTGMFLNCSSLTSLDLSGFDTPNVKFMTDMFSKCSSLTSLDLSGFKTSKVSSMARMFSKCSSLTSLDLSDFDTSNVTSMNEMFDGCSSLTSLNLSKFNVSNVTAMYEMFDGCSSLTSLNLNFSPSKVTSMRQMFYNCSSLTSLDLSNFDTSKVTNMEKMFEKCERLQTLDLSSFDTSKVTNMSQMFRYCYALSNITFGDKFDTSNVTNISYMFSYTKNLQTLSAKISFDTKNVTNMQSIFQECFKLSDSALDSIGFKNFNTSRVQIFGSIFSGCENLSIIDLSNWNFSQATSSIAFGTGQDHALTVHTIIMPANMSTEVMLPISYGNTRKWYSAYDPYVIYEKTCANIDTAITYVSILTPQLDKTTLTLTDKNETAELTTTVSPLNITDTHVTYQSTNPAVATVDPATGTVTAVSNGNCEIIVKADDINESSAACSVTVHVHEWSADWDKDGTGHWHKCTVTSPACPITDNKQKDGYSAHTYDNAADKTCNTCGYVRKINVTGVSLDRHSIKLIDKGSTAAVTATVTPSTADVLAVSYKSSDIKVATVDKNGEIKAVGNGTCTITATSADNAKAYDTCTVTVHVHKWSSKWQNNKTHHWHTCANSGCHITANSEKYAYGEHFYDDVLDKTCNDCGYVRKIVIKDEKGSSGNALANRTDMPILLVTGSCYKKKHVKLTWTKYARASGYEVYWSYCDGRQNYKRLGSVKKPKYTHKNLKKNREYKYFVIAYKKIGGKKVYLCKSPSIHVAMSYDKRTNVKKIKTNKTKLTLEKNKTFQIKVTLMKQKKSKKLIDHVSKIRYYTTNKKVATVSKTGEITAKNVGQCTIYVAANSGLTKKIVVKVW